MPYSRPFLALSDDSSINISPCLFYDDHVRGSDVRLAQGEYTAGGDASALFDGGNRVTDSIEDCGITDKALTISNVPSLSASTIHAIACPAVATHQSVVDLDSLASQFESHGRSFDTCRLPGSNGLVVFDGENDVTNTEDHDTANDAFTIPTCPVTRVRDLCPNGNSVPVPGASIVDSSYPGSHPQKDPLPNSSMTCHPLIVINSGHIVVDRRLRSSRTLALSIGCANRASPIGSGYASYEGASRIRKGIVDVVAGCSEKGVREGGVDVESRFGPPVSGGGESGSDYTVGLGCRIGGGVREGNTSPWRSYQMENTRSMFRHYGVEPPDILAKVKHMFDVGVCALTFFGIGRHGNIESDDGGKMTFITYEPVDKTELTPEVEPVVTSLTRDIIAHIRVIIRASSLRRQRFQDLQRAAGRDPLELLRDVETRWSSTLLMIERLLELKPYVIQMLRERDLEKYAIHEHEWEVLPIYKRILRVPHSFQQALSGEKTPTLHDSLPLFHTMITAWTAMKVSLPQYTDIIDAGISKLKEYWQRIHTVPAYTLAMLVNPAVKLEWYRKHSNGRTAWAKQLFIDKLKTYRGSNAPDTPAPIRHTSSIPSIDDEPDDFNIHANQIFRGRRTGPRVFRSVQEEVDTYLLDTRVASPLSYWKEHQDDYPTIFALAMDILPIQGSAVPCERVFSSAKETITPRRNRIRSRLMESLQMLKFSRRHPGIELDFSVGTSREAEIEALERESEERSRIPDDYSTYLNSLLSDIDEESDMEDEEEDDWEDDDDM
ncbi:hypothetical protein D9611_006667 [Ephemerocybe angulata]|uniref:HAT C-terminal dimerisation domain-containing protein n=1 Tax=Ephemerocybe angulata TaxID=980116 RepID=A0A8H5C7A1_9AGAR|nr:hypothetical protein D9611_006667 [Tulosesus angulatus]